jgi:F-type H+-transporting ATPase subunit gamma
MQNTNEIGHHIKAIRDTRQITNAVKLISAAKLRKARLQLEKTLPYFEKVKLTMADILTHSGNIKNKYFDVRHQKKGKKRGYIVFAADKGLAGGYNHNIFKTAEAQLERFPGSMLYVAGHVGYMHFLSKGYNVDEGFDYPVQNPTVARARGISEYILKQFDSGNVDEVYVIYTYLVTTLRLEMHVMKLLPLDLGGIRMELGLDEQLAQPLNEDLIYEPSPEAVFDVLVSQYVKGIIYGAMVEAFTSEQSSRMMSMDNATDNADKMLKDLELQYNRARQSAITQEITEIIGGASALGK